mgnify:CR=1 FL=1
MMKRWLGPMFAAMVLLTACVTINVHFPAVEAREAAREFVDDVIGRPADADAPADDLFDGGGMALAQQGEILAHVAMPIAGMLSDLPAAEQARQIRELRDLSSQVADWEPPYRVFKAI